MKITRYFIITSVLLVIIGCPYEIDPIDSELTIINNSDSEIVYYFQLKTINDTSLATISFPLIPENTESVIIQPQDNVVLREGFKRILKADSSKVLMIYLFSRDTIKQVSWERIRDEYLVLRRYDLTLEDLEALNWTIEYP